MSLLKHIALALALASLAACAKPDQSVTCAREGVGAERALYPDGQTRKSYVYSCSDGCYKYASVANEQVSFNSCERL